MEKRNQKLTPIFEFDKTQMIKKIDTKKVIEYWQKIAEHDYEVMLYLFRGKKYSDSLERQRVMPLNILNWPINYIYG